MTQVKQEGRLSRWSRRKQQTAEETRQEDAIEIEQQAVSDNNIQHDLADDQAQSEPQQPVLCDADMEPVESLSDNSDFSKFMSPGVSDKLRNLALRKMFNAPIFNIRDGLDEYDEDYTTFEKLGDIVTADMRHQMELEAERKREQEAQEIAELEESSDQQDQQDQEIEDEQTPAISGENEAPDEVEIELTAGGDETPDRSIEKQPANNG